MNYEHQGETTEGFGKNHNKNPTILLISCPALRELVYTGLLYIRYLLGTLSAI